MSPTAENNRKNLEKDRVQPPMSEPDTSRSALGAALLISQSAVIRNSSGILRCVLNTQYHCTFNLLKPTGYVMHQQFNIQQLYALPTLFMCFYLRTNSDLCHLQHKLICFHNRDEKCLQRGTDWVFK